METDGWYIDFEQQFDCGDSASYSSYNAKNKPTCQDKYVMKTVGAAKRGYPVYEKMTMFDESGNESIVLHKRSCRALKGDTGCDPLRRAAGLQRSGGRLPDVRGGFDKFDGT